ncbi:MAG: TlpA disulfide reductase family protein [Gammaproteobacteria bacterium]|nr:TlpA disulfide reductase family protein [Gammaproteobacteria bacterium]MDX2488516.1 TlpA disulfide reductase family protein [Gammaproteobacteria bacterium]
MTAKLWLMAGLAMLAGVLASLYLNTGVIETRQNQNAAISLDQINLLDLDGNKQSLSQWQGKVLLVNFWATWCPPCREEIPVFLSLRKKFSSDGFEVVGISIDDANKVKQYRRSMQIDYPLLDGEQSGMPLMVSLGNPTGGLPFSVLYDRKGDVVQIKTGAYGHQELQDLIEKLL